jgi:Arc/MetJ family transcription regulator
MHNCYAYIPCIKGVKMRTTLDLDEKLLKEALELSAAPSKKEVIEKALKEYIARIKRKSIIDSFGKLDIDLDVMKYRELSTIQRNAGVNEPDSD